MRANLMRRMMVFLTVVAVIMLNLPLYALGEVSESTATVAAIESGNGSKVDIVFEDAGDNPELIVFHVPGRAVINIDFDESKYTDIIREGVLTISLYAKKGTTAVVTFEDTDDNGTKFGNVKFKVDDDKNEYTFENLGIENSEGLIEFPITFGVSQNINVIHDDDEPSDIDGVVNRITSWKDELSSEDGLESVDPITNPNVIASEFYYYVWVKDITDIPELNPVPVSADASIFEQELNTNDERTRLIEVTVAAQDTEHEQEYYFLFVERETPYIELYGDDETILKGSEYSDKGAKAFYQNTDLEYYLNHMPNLDVMSNENIDGVPDYVASLMENITVDYHFQDKVLVYTTVVSGNVPHEDNWIYLEAESSRDVEVVDPYIEGPEGKDVTTDGHILYKGTAITGFDQVELSFAPAGNYDDVVWTLADAAGNPLDNDIVTLTVVGDIATVVAKNIGEQWVQVLADGSMAMGLIEVLPNNLPVITMNPVPATDPMEFDVTIPHLSDYNDPGALAEDEEDGSENIPLGNDADNVNLTTSMVVTNSENEIIDIASITDELGTYTITYAVVDSMGNEDSEVRTVIVEPIPIDDIQIWYGDDNITDSTLNMMIGDFSSHEKDQVDLDYAIYPEGPPPPYVDGVWSLPDGNTIIDFALLDPSDERDGVFQALSEGEADVVYTADGVEATTSIKVFTNTIPWIDLEGDDTVYVYRNVPYSDPIPATTYGDQETAYGNLSYDVVVTNSDHVVVDENTFTNVLGEYTITYKVTDNVQDLLDAGFNVEANSNFVTRTIVVDNNFPPIIDVSDESLYQSFTPFDVSVTVQDVEDPTGFDVTDLESDLPIDVEIKLVTMVGGATLLSEIPDNLLNIEVPGEYTVRYFLTDSLGNEYKTGDVVGYDRTITVLAYPAPVVTIAPDNMWIVGSTEVNVEVESLPGYTVYYALNRDVLIDEYVDSFVITEDTIVYARAINEFGTPSELAMKEYMVPYVPTNDDDDDDDGDDDRDPRPKKPSVVISKDPVELEYGTEADESLFSDDVDAKVYNSNDDDVTWSIDDDTVATVDQDGVVTAVKQGETTLRVEHDDSGATDSATVIVFLVGDEINPLGLVEFYDPYVFGYPDQTFRPTNDVTRAEVATMFAKILKLNVDYPGSQKFVDVNLGQWYYNYVQAIQRTNIFVGDPSGNFRPDDPITRAEMATVFGKFWEYLRTPVDRSQVEITDVDGTHWASKYIYMMYNAGIVVGFEDGSYRPDDATLREQVVIMINTLIERPEFKAPFSKFTDINSGHWAFGNIEAASQPFAHQENILLPE